MEKFITSPTGIVVMIALFVLGLIGSVYLSVKLSEYKYNSEEKEKKEKFKKLFEIPPDEDNLEIIDKMVRAKLKSLRGDVETVRHQQLLLEARATNEVLGIDVSPEQIAMIHEKQDGDPKRLKLIVQYSEALSLLEFLKAIADERGYPHKD